MRKKSFGDDLYDGSAAFGRVMGVIAAVMGTIIGIGIIIAGIIMLVKKLPDNDTTPNKDQSKIAKTLFGVGFIVFGILIIGGGWLTYYLTRSSKVGTAAVGVGSAIDMVANSILR